MKKGLLATLALTATLVISACSSPEEGTIQLENGNDTFVSVKGYDVTKQDVFNTIGLQNTLSALLDLVDYDVLSAKLGDDVNAIKEDVMTTVSEYKELVEKSNELESFEEYLTMQGFETEEDFVRYLELSEFRTAVIESTIEITDEEIQSAYDTKYAPKEDETKDEEATDEAKEEEEEKEVPTLDEVRDALKAEIMSSKMTNEVVLAALAQARSEAGLTLNNEELANTYQATFDPNYKATEDASKEALATTSSTSYTTEQVYDTAIDALGLSTGVSLIDEYLLAKEFDVSDDDVKAEIDNYKVQLGEQYYPYMLQQIGVSSDEAIFDYFRVIKLQEAAYEANYPVTEEQVKNLYTEYEKEFDASVAARHILVETEEEAKEIIAKLDEAEDKEETFKTLAAEHSTDGSATNGGDLGTFGKGKMVEEFETAAFALEVDTYTDKPVESQFGFHIIYRYAAEKASFEELKPQLEMQAQNENYTSERLEKILMDFRDESEFKFSDEVIQARYEKIREQILASIEAAEKKADSTEE